MNKMSFSSLFGVGAKDDGDFAEIGDRPASEFRHRLYNVPEEEEDLTEAFKIRIGLIKKEDTLAGIHEVEQMNEVEKDATLSKFKFKKFVETCYNSKLLSFSKEPIKEPVLNHIRDDSSEENVLNLSALVISHAIKQFCKDVTTTSNKKISDDTKPSILILVGNNLETLKKSSAGQKENKVKRNSMLKIFQSKHKGDDKKTPLDQLLETIPTSDLEVAQFIVAYGLLKKDLRDEIFCQLSNQVSSNPSDQSTSSGWILHVLCAGCFKPTSKLLRYYMSFLNDAVKDSVDYAKQVLTLLHRVNSFGARSHPPTSLEFLAVKSRKKIMLPVILADGSVQPVLADSVTTASEMCHAVCKAANMKEQFGFAVNISIAGKVSSLGNGLDHVMDAIAECEQVLKEPTASKLSPSGDNAGWQLTFGKELFTPWHDAEVDPKSSSLIYKQICRSIENGEFRFKSDEDLAKFLARRCFVEIGPNLSKEDLRSNIKHLLPKAILNGNSFKENDWMDLIISTFEKMDLKGKRLTQLQVLCSIVEGAHRKWPLQFSALFEVTKISGPPLSNNELVIAISCRGIFLLEEPFNILQGLHYYEIVEVTLSKSVNGVGPCFSLTTIKGDCWTFESANSGTVAKLLCTFLDGLRRRSKWAIAIEEFILRDHSKVLTDDFHLQHGDVVELLDETKQKQLREDWMFGKSERTGKIGPFPFDSIYILPTSEKPPKTFLNLFSGMSRKDFSTLPRKRGAIVLGKSTMSKIPELKEHSAI